MTADVTTTVARVLADHRLLPGMNVCRTRGGFCDWRPVYDAGSLADQHETHLAAKVAEALAGPAPDDDLAALVNALTETDAVTATDGETLHPDTYVVHAENLPYLVRTVLNLRTPAPEGDDREALTTAVRSVYDRHDHTRPLNHVNVVEWVDAVLAAGFRRAPEGKTVTEWGVRAPDGTLYDGEEEGLRWTREQAEYAREDNGTSRDVFVRRDVTSRPDVVTEWEVASDE